MAAPDSLVPPAGSSGTTGLGKRTRVLEAPEANATTRGNHELSLNILPTCWSLVVVRDAFHGAGPRIHEMAHNRLSTDKL